MFMELMKEFRDLGKFRLPLGLCFHSQKSTSRRFWAQISYLYGSYRSAPVARREYAQKLNDFYLLIIHRAYI